MNVWLDPMRPRLINLTIQNILTIISTATVIVTHMKTGIKSWNLLGNIQYCKKIGALKSFAKLTENICACNLIKK